MGPHNGEVSSELKAVSEKAGTVLAKELSVVHSFDSSYSTSYDIMIPIIHGVVCNKRADAAPQSVAGNAQTTSSQQACHNHQFQLVSHYATVRGLSPGRIFLNVETTEQMGKTEV
jgi:hypothetical protein